MKLRYRNKFIHKLWLWYINKIKYRKKMTYWDWKENNRERLGL